MQKSVIIGLIVYMVMLCKPGLFAQTIAINEIVSLNQQVIFDEDSNYSDYIELYNYGTNDVNLSGFGLTDDQTNPFKWVFGNTVIAPGTFLLVWASDKNRFGAQLHTNFKISSSGEVILLTAPNQNRVDSAPAVSLTANYALVKLPDGVGSWQITAQPTPATINKVVTTLAPPNFSHQSGLYTGSFNLSLSHTNPNAVIVYTLDGSEPNLNNTSGTTYSYKNEYKREPTDSVGILLYRNFKSNVYAGPILIKDRSSEPDQLAKINTRQYPLYIPPNQVRKAMVVKAKVYVDTASSVTTSKTFFVWASGNPFKIPILSLQIQEDYLFDYQKGTYTAGIDYDTWRATDPTNTQWSRPEWCNYWRSGEAWEYPLHLEIFNEQSLNSVLSKNAGYRIHGNNSRTLPIKNLRFYARSDGDFELNLFKDKLTDATKPTNKTYKRLMLRGDGTGGPIFYDVVFNRLMLPFYNGICRIQPAVHFINGEYWGLTALRDRLDEHHFELNYGVPSKEYVSVDCMANNCNLEEGEDKHFQEYIAMRDFILTHNMADSIHFAKVDSLLDITNFINHMVLEVFAANDSYERTFWKVKTKLNKPFCDGKWRLTIQDFEASLRDYKDLLNFYSNPNNLPNEALFGNLLANQQFKNQFINRTADLLNTGFLEKRFKTIVDSSFAEVSAYLTEDRNRIYREGFYDPFEIQYLYQWAETWPDRLRDSMIRQYNLSGLASLNIDINTVGAGFVKVNSVNINNTTPGVEANTYPWTGTYFKQVPFWIKAIPNPGYVFSHWSGGDSTTRDSLLINLNENQLWIAHFIKDTTYKNTLYFWMMDTNIPNDTPLQYLVSTYSNSKQTGQVQFQSCFAGYPFYTEHPRWRLASMERKNSPTAINYRLSANQNIPFENSNMRGIQIKQPMRNGLLENTLNISCSTLKQQHIQLSFAVSSNGAASSLVTEYWNGTAWDTSFMPQATFNILPEYTLVQANFAQVPQALNNTEFKCRIRFLGENMFEDSDKYVAINNLAIDGDTLLQIGLKNTQQNQEIYLKYFPNPTQSTIHIWADKPIKQVEVYNQFGQIVKTAEFNQLQVELKFEELSAGVYFVKVKCLNNLRTLKIIKQ